MKITTEHYQILETAILAKHNDMLVNHATDYATYRAAGHSTKRIVWDLCNAAGMNPFICDTLYKYLNDTHIDTALLKIAKQL